MLAHMRRLGLLLSRAILAAVVLPLLLLTVMVLIAAQAGALGAVFIHPDASGPIDPLLLSSDYATRMLQITGWALAYQLSWLFVLMAFPYLLLNGDLRFGFGG